MMLRFEELPEGMRMWGAHGGKRQYLITVDDEDSLYGASCQTIGGSQTTYLIDYDKRVKSFDEAVQICQQVEAEH